jgi:hypothetical protein
MSAAGYLPIGVDLAASTVTLGRIVGRDFSETWYDDTVRARPPDTIATVPVRLFLEQGADLVPAAPLRLIGHVSRCGSTLLSNLLALRPRTMVLKEPDFVTDVAHWSALSAHPVDQQRHAELLAGLLIYTCHAANANDRASVVKVTSWTTPVVMASLARHVDTTWLLQWREAHDVVASNLATPPGWGDSSERGGAARRAMGLRPSLTDEVELYASVWAKVVAAFAEAPDGVQYRALGYDELASGKEECLLAAEAWFGVVGGQRPPGYAEESARYSKGDVGERFDGTGNHRRPDLHATALRRVEELTGASNAWLRTSAQRLI